MSMSRTPRLLSSREKVLHYPRLNVTAILCRQESADMSYSLQTTRAVVTAQCCWQRVQHAVEKQLYEARFHSFTTFIVVNSHDFALF